MKKLRKRVRAAIEREHELGAELVEVVIGIAVVLGLGAAIYSLQGTLFNSMESAGAGMSQSYNQTGSSTSATISITQNGGAGSEEGEATPPPSEQIDPEPSTDDNSSDTDTLDASPDAPDTEAAAEPGGE